MGYGVKLRVWGDYACFTRPEFKVERVSYDVMTPSAARGILEAIHWKPAIRWVVDRIVVLNEIRFESLRKTEISSKVSWKTARRAMALQDPALVAQDASSQRQQRRALVLRDVDYVIEGHFEMTGKAKNDSAAQHAEMFRRRARKGQCFQRPSLGLREFEANFDLIEETPMSQVRGRQDLGWMLYDLDYAHECRAVLFKAELVDGVLDVAAARVAGDLR